MDFKEKIDRLAQNGEDRMLLAKVLDRLTMGKRKNIPAYTSFLSLREQELVRRLLGEEDLIFFGGFPGAERAVACYLPDYLEEDSLMENGPVEALRATYYDKDVLSHRDFLGSLMGCGVKRETVGDICVGEGSCDFFVLQEIAPYVEQNLISAGRTKLHVEKIPLNEVNVPIPKTEQRRDTLASLRLDGVMSAGFRIGRSAAVKHILGGSVAIDGLPCVKPDKLVEEGVVVSARGLGKIKLTEIGNMTKKGRISVEIEKFI